MEAQSDLTYEQKIIHSPIFEPSGSMFAASGFVSPLLSPLLWGYQRRGELLVTPKLMAHFLDHVHDSLHSEQNGYFGNLRKRHVGSDNGGVPRFQDTYMLSPSA